MALFYFLICQWCLAVALAEKLGELDGTVLFFGVK